VILHEAAERRHKPAAAALRGACSVGTASI